MTQIRVYTKTESDAAYVPITSDIALAAHKITATSTAHTASLGNVTSDSDTQTVMKLVPTGVPEHTFYMHITQADVGTQARPDNVVMLGPNITAGGGLAASGTRIGALALSFEPYFEQTPGTVTTGQMEMHWLFVDPAGVQHRPISLIANLTSPYPTTLYVFDTTIVLGSGKDSNDPASVTINSTTTLLQAPTGNYRVSLDDTSEQLLLLVNDKNTGLLAAHAVLYQDSGIELKSSYGRIVDSNSHTRMEWGATQMNMTSPDGGKIFTVNNAALWLSNATIDMIKVTDSLITLGVTAKTVASTTGSAGLRLTTGVAPTSPTDGDMWQDGTNFKIRINGTTKTVTLT